MSAGLVVKADAWTWTIVGSAVLVLLVIFGLLWDRYMTNLERECWWCNHLPEFLVGWHLRRVADRMPDQYADFVDKETYDALEDETWGDELHQMNAELRDEEGEQAAPGGHPIYAELSDDPDLIVWDAAQQAKRCWEIVNIEFPRLRTQLLAEYAVAA